jgi:hypothetical protein
MATPSITQSPGEASDEGSFAFHEEIATDLHSKRTLESYGNKSGSLFLPVNASEVVMR